MRGKKWDIFCRVVDNFGDIGICWRLARQLAAEHGLEVRLWVDDLASFHCLCPDIDPDPILAMQMLHGVVVRRWDTPFRIAAGAEKSILPDVVVEAFACELPEAYLAAMASRQEKPAWINLEYLSAEHWVGSCHGLASPHPRLPLTKHFFFPGFVSGSGGLLRETALLRQRAAWQADAVATWQQLGLPSLSPEETAVSLFCYDNPALPDLLNSWIAGRSPMRCLIPEGLALAQAVNCLQTAPLHAGERLRQGNLTVYALPFSSQENYDRLLWSCDFNFVRGEDSFVRAQWAARPFVWHIYPQEDAAHHAKLDAFLALYCAGLPQPTAEACRNFWHAWNRVGKDNAAKAWADYWQHRAELSAHAKKWAAQLAEPVDIASRLVDFCENLL
ncbi:MAG: elongation factor P maturation arginine rhamnosyltransferase EarP [Sterolibacterium sp.]